MYASKSEPYPCAFRFSPLYSSPMFVFCSTSPREKKSAACPPEFPVPSRRLSRLTPRLPGPRPSPRQLAGTPDRLTCSLCWSVRFSVGSTRCLVCYGFAAGPEISEEARHGFQGAARAILVECKDCPLSMSLQYCIRLEGTAINKIDSWFSVKVIFSRQKKMWL